MTLSDGYSAIQQTLDITPWYRSYEPYLKDLRTTVTGCLPDFKQGPCRRTAHQVMLQR